MKKNTSSGFAGIPLALVFIAVLFPSCRSAYVSPDQGVEALQVTAVDPLDKILRETSLFKEIDPVAHVARGEHATLQFVVRSESRITGLSVSISDIVSSGGDALPSAQVGFVGYVGVGRSTPTPSRDRIPSPSGFYPDPILDLDKIDVPPRTAQPIWITIAIPSSATATTYRGVVNVMGRIDGVIQSMETEFSVIVYPTRIEQTLWVTNWFTVDPEKLGMMNDGKRVESDTPLYWSLVETLAKKMAEYRQNVAIISPLRLADYDIRDGQYEIDFRRFDRTVEIFIDAGVVGRIEGGHIGGRESTWTTPFVVSVPVERDGAVVFDRFPISEEPATSFYRQFIPELVTHLKEKGWYEKYVQHLADEPIEENIDSYVEMARYIRDLAPDMKFIEANHSRNLQDQVDVWVPQLNFVHEDYSFYKDRQLAGDEIWFYTCLAPQGEYANRFIELPLIKTRILHWINFRFGITGYLHWGLNFWRANPFEETTGIITESGNVLPGGDAWIVYPAKGRVLSSIRLEAMRDGIADYELLRMLAERLPDEADELARQVVYRFDLYDVNVPAFREKRRRILRLLSQ